MKLVILEGPDGAGKTTLARRLENQYGFKVVHAGPPSQKLSEEQTLRRFLLPVVRAKVPTVFDRLHLGELVYGPVLRGGSALTPRAWNLLERYYAAMDAQVVICLPPYRECFQSWLNSKERQLVKQAAAFQKIYAGYVNLWLNSRSYVRFDYTRHRDGAMAEALIVLNGHPLPAGCVGTQWPRFLFLGEQANGQPDLPFMSTRGSSGWLYDVLREAGYREEELAFANTRDAAGGVRGLDKLLGHFNGHPPTLVALGTVAQQACRGQHLACEDLEHPQHWKRFHTAQRADYVARLAKIRRTSP